MDWLLNLIPGGGLTATIAGLVVALLSGLGLYKSVQKSGYNKRVAEEAKARDKNLERIADAAGAKPVGSVLDDPNNRDNWPDRT